MVTYPIKDLIDCAMARVPATLIIKDSNVVSVATNEILTHTDIIIKDSYIVGIGKAEKGHVGPDTKIVDLKGQKFISPGLIDSHIHIESSMLGPTSFAKAVIPHGTTTIVCDPHEIGNVLGIRGVELVIDEAKQLSNAMRILIEAPSCVPSLGFAETSGATIDAAGIRQLLDNPQIFGLAEVMNFPGVYLGDKEILEKINAAIESRKIIDGHAPGISGKELNAYATARIRSDHECTTATEAVDKLRRGMHIQIREGSFAKNMKTLITDLKKMNVPLDKCSVCSDDRHPDDLMIKGHLDHSLRILVNELKLPPIEALKLVTTNVARYIGKIGEFGEIAPGKYADLVIFDDLKSFEVVYTIFQGKIVAENGKMSNELNSYQYPEWAISTTQQLKIPVEAELMVKAPPKANKVTAWVIKVLEHSLVTEKLIAELECKNGYIVPAIKNDILPIAVIDRHTGSGNIGKGFVTGLGLKKGAIATTVAHDSHQVIVTGTDYQLMIQAVQKIKEIGGGYVIVSDKGITALSLRYGGIMSTNSVIAVVDDLKKVREAIKIVGTTISEPLMALSFLALPVIPKLKLTDRGLFDGEQFKLIPVTL